MARNRFSISPVNRGKKIKRWNDTLSFCHNIHILGFWYGASKII